MQTNFPDAACLLESESEPETSGVPPIELELGRAAEAAAAAAAGEEEAPGEEAPPEPPRAFECGRSYSQTHHISKASRKVKSKDSRKVNLRKSFDIKFICSTLPRQRIINSCEIIPNSHAKQDYTGVFLAHARLYIFADKYGIESLESLSLHKLHATLKSFTLSRARVGDILKLARYAYENGSDYKRNKLRALVSEYIACEIDTIGETERFLALMEGGGLFVRDFWKLVRKNLL
jgi:hypothetical protein